MLALAEATVGICAASAVAIVGSAVIDEFEVRQPIKHINEFFLLTWLASYGGGLGKGLVQLG
jgi:hypothetical protein